MGFTNGWTSSQQIETRLDVIRESVTGLFILSDWKKDKNTKIEFAKVVMMNGSRPSKIRLYYEEYGGLHDIMNDINDKVLTCLIPENDN